MTIKNKLRAGFSFLFALALLSCGLSIYFLNRLSADAKAILKDNYKSVQYAKNMGVAMDANIGFLDAQQEKTIEDNLVKEEHNITERGEGPLTAALRAKYEELKLLNNDPVKAVAVRNEIKELLYEIGRAHV